MFLFLKNGGTNSIIFFIFSFVINEVEENLDSIIWSIDRQHKIAGSLFEKAANEYDFLNINDCKFSSSSKGFFKFECTFLLISSWFLFINLNIFQIQNSLNNLTKSATHYFQIILHTNFYYQINHIIFLQ